MFHITFVLSSLSYHPQIHGVIPYRHFSKMISKDLEENKSGPIIYYQDTKRFGYVSDNYKGKIVSSKAPKYVICAINKKNGNHYFPYTKLNSEVIDIKKCYWDKPITFNQKIDVVQAMLEWIKPYYAPEYDTLDIEDSTAFDFAIANMGELIEGVIEEKLDVDDK